VASDFGDMRLVSNIILFFNFKSSEKNQSTNYQHNYSINRKRNKLVGRAGNIYPLWVWRYGFSHYTTGRVWRLTGFR